jgi:hypothetical protein
MKPHPARRWTALSPPLRGYYSREMYLELGRAIAKTAKTASEETRDDALNALRGDFVGSVGKSRYQDAAALLAAGLVIIDLAIQGWPLRVRAEAVEVQPPEQSGIGLVEEKNRIRQQELVKRNSQLRQPSVVKFLSSMEQVRLHKGKFVSIFSLMRDGRELASALLRMRKLEGGERDAELARVVDPYLQFVGSNADVCQFTGLRLMDVWRYFRHTWSNQYMSVPGRSMQFLVRDRAAPNHPVMGICALSSPIMQIRERDNWIGWSPEAFLDRVQNKPSAKLAKWLVSTLDEAIRQIYRDDLIEDGVVSSREIVNPTPKLIERLLSEGLRRRKLHYRFVQPSEHKGRQSNLHVETHWQERAKTHLFRSKRAISLATLLKARIAIKEAFGHRPSRDSLTKLVATRAGQEAVRAVLRKAKADRVGISVADISVCGAVQPYNALLGGKLVAMLAASPEVVAAYHERYRQSESEIASSMAGKPIIRKPHLVMLGTTSLYGVGSSQYNRIRIPAEKVGGTRGGHIEYKELGHSESFGTSQYSDETVQALADYAQQCDGGQRVNSIFGEGVSPKLRKVRQGLDALGFPSSLLLQHHRRRIVYGVALIGNLCDYLVGADKTPKYLYRLRPHREASDQIARWWRERWLHRRIESDEVLSAVERHTLVAPVRHGARVARPGRSNEQPSLFSETG